MPQSTGKPSAVLGLLVALVGASAAASADRTGWFHEAGWGVMTHYLGAPPSSAGGAELTAEMWNKQVDAFDVPGLVEQVASTGAKYLLFTIGQNSGHYCAPNATYDKIVGIVPSKCSRRDLVAELSQALGAKGIKLLVYLPSGAPAADPVARKKLGWRWGRPGGWQLPGEPVGGRLAEFQRHWEAVIRAWSLRWGQGVAGWWIDGCYFADQMYRFDDEPNFASFAAALRAGNPEAIVAFNPGVRIPVAAHSKHEDYAAGEVNLKQLPQAVAACPGRWLECEGAKVQFHILTFLGKTWCAGDRPQWPDEKVIALTKQTVEKGGVVTFDVPIEKSGRIPQPFVEQLRAIGRALAKGEAPAHRFSTLFTAQNVRDLLATDEGIDAAIRWCKATSIRKVYLETFRSRYTAQREALQRARERFRAAGFEVAGCVTTTLVGKRSTGWNLISCYTDRATQDQIQEIFEYAAGLFDEIMIDDFWFTDCKCPECDAARHAKTVTIGQRAGPVVGDTWEDYRSELMVRLSRERILEPARRVNPKVQIIIKYPQWYDQFHERGYDVARQTADFDRIWVGTETRDYTDPRWGGTVQYEAYFIMRWLGGIGGPKCGGGWYDPYGTTEHTYVEQARQTVLGGARESLLFCYGSLLKETGPKNVEALRAAMPELLAVAGQVARSEAIGVAAYKPPSSRPEKEGRVFDFVGMMGLPLAPCHEFPAGAKAAFFSVHALKDPTLAERLSAMIAAGTPVLVTDGLAQRLSGKVKLDGPHVRVLPVQGDPKSLLKLPQDELDRLREPLLRPLGRRFQAPNRVALYLFADGSWVVENFNDEPADVKLDGATHKVPARAWIYHWQ